MPQSEATSLLVPLLKHDPSNLCIKTGAAIRGLDRENRASVELSTPHRIRMCVVAQCKTGGRGVCARMRRLVAGRRFSATTRSNRKPAQLHFFSISKNAPGLQAAAHSSRQAGRAASTSLRLACEWGGGVAYRRFAERGVAFRRAPEPGTAKLLGNRHRLPPWISAICCWPG